MSLVFFIFGSVVGSVLTYLVVTRIIPDMSKRKEKARYEMYKQLKKEYEQK